MEKTKINYVKGDATNPIGDGKKIIVHVCNSLGKWGSGFVMAISKKWEAPERIYRGKSKYQLGTFDLVKVEENIVVCNLIGQEGVKGDTNSPILPPVRYIAIEVGLKKLADIIKKSPNKDEISVHAPMFGSDRAGGTWDIIEKIIEHTLCNEGIPVTIYEFDGK